MSRPLPQAVLTCGASFVAQAEMTKVWTGRTDGRIIVAGESEVSDMSHLIDVAPDISGLITEDETPVDNLPSEKQQRLLTEPLYSSWEGAGEHRPFLAAANVGVFSAVRHPAIVPDMFLSLDVEVAEDWWRKEHRSYFLWEFGKPPDVVIEIVSNTVGGEDTEKKKKYARMHVTSYVIYDPQQQLMPDVLTIYQLRGFAYERQQETQFPFNLGLTLWDGVFEGKASTWLRWTDQHGEIILTGRERAEAERQRADEEHQRADEARQRADEERQRADEERQRADEARQRADEERQRADEEQKRADEEQKRADEEQKRAAQAEQGEAAQRQRAEQAEQLLEQERRRLEHMAGLLRQLGKDPEQL